MKHFFSSKVRAIIIVAVILCAGLALVTSLTDLRFPQQVVQGMLTPLRSGVQALTRQAEQFYNYMFRYEALEAENDALRQRIAELEEGVRAADSMARENERLKDLLELTAARDDFAMVDSYIIGRSSVDWTSTLTIDRGSGDGIEEGMCVVTADSAVVGLVIEVGHNYSIVKTVLDSSLEISGTIASAGYNGIVQGAYVTGEAGMLRMDYLPSSAVIRNRDQVVTSGSTVYPRDLIMGYVVDAGFDETGVAKYALLEPAADMGSLEQVFVLTAFRKE